MKLSPEYIAGFFDGEGCVQFSRCRSSFYPRVLIVNTDKVVLRAIQRQFGGGIGRLSRRERGWRQGYVLRLSWSKAIRFIKAIIDHLVVKFDAALTALAWDVARPGKGAVWDKETADFLIARMTWLNRKGPRFGEDPLDTVLREIKTGQTEMIL